MPLVDGGVATAKGMAEAYRSFAGAGWTSLSEGSGTYAITGTKIFISSVDTTSAATSFTSSSPACPTRRRA